MNMIRQSGKYRRLKHNHRGEKPLRVVFVPQNKAAAELRLKFRKELYHHGK